MSWRAPLLDAAGMAAAVALFCLLALWRLDLPGMYQDEALDVVPALRFLQGHGGGPYSLLPGRLDLPLMVSDHVGPTSTYLLVPFLRTFGVGSRAVRLYEFACGLVALGLMFLWLKRATAPGFAGLGALLLAAMPSFWLGGRNGIHVSFMMLPLAAAALLCGDRWLREKSDRWLYAGAFLLGLGLSTKILFVWFLLATAAATAWLMPAARPPLGRRQIALSLTWFALGAAPLVVFNLLTRGLTLRTLLASLHETPYGVHNAAFLPNLHTQLRSFTSLVEGSWLTWAGDAPRNPVALITFLASASYLIGQWRLSGWNRPRFALLVAGLITLQSCFTITTLGPKHLVILLPLLPAVIAGAMALAWSQRAHLASRVAFFALCALAAAQFLGDLRSDLTYRRSLAQTGGIGLFSSAHDQLAADLARQGRTRPFAGDWGFGANLEVVSGGRVVAQPLFELSEPAPYRFTVAQARQALSDPDRVYLFHAADATVAPGRREAVAQVAQEMGRPLRLVALFRDGRRREVIRVERASRPR